MSLIEEIATELNGIEYDDVRVRHINTILRKFPCRNRDVIIVAFPSSNDLVVFCGAIGGDAYHNGPGTEIYLSGGDRQGKVLGREGQLPRDVRQIIMNHAAFIEVSEDETDHAICLSLGQYDRIRNPVIGKFDIMEDGERYGQGIVFSLDGLERIPSVEEVYGYWFSSGNM